MKRAVTALVALGIATVTCTPASAVTTVYGSAQIKYTVNATASVAISTNYVAATGAQAAGAATILPSVAGNCTAGVAETTATMTFGGITPPTSGYTGCYYENAIAIGVLSNDAAGVKVAEYTDTLATGTQICAYPQDAALAASPTASGASGNPAGYTTSCGTVNSKTGTALVGLGAATAGTGFGAAGNPGSTDVTATPTATTYTAGGLVFCGGVCTGTTGAAYKWLGQDIQMNVSGSASSGAATNVITIAVIPQ